MKPLIASLAFLLAAPLAQAALVITEFGLGPDGQEFVVIANTASGPAINLTNLSISVDNGVTTNPLGLSNTMQPGETAILSRQTIPNFAATYGSQPILTATYFATIEDLDFLASGASGIILDNGGTPFYSVGYGGGGYTGDLCVVINPPSGPPTTAVNTTAFSTIPEPGSAMLSAIALLGLLTHRRR